MTTPPRMVRVELAAYGLNDLEDCATVDDVRALLNKIEAQVPEQFRETLTWDFWAGDRDDGPSLNIAFERPETDLDRQNKERAEREREAARLHVEYQQYLRLKVKYEGSK